MDQYRYTHSCIDHSQVSSGCVLTLQRSTRQRNTHQRACHWHECHWNNTASPLTLLPALPLAEMLPNRVRSRLVSRTLSNLRFRFQSDLDKTLRDPEITVYFDVYWPDGVLLILNKSVMKGGYCMMCVSVLAWTGRYSEDNIIGGFWGSFGVSPGMLWLLLTTYWGNSCWQRFGVGD